MFCFKEMSKEYVNGCVAGMVGQTLCHPFDTIKTRYQRWGQVTYSGLYRGLPGPLMSVIIEKSILFGTYDWIRTKVGTGYGVFGAGVGAGLMTTLTVVPFERIKVLVQLNRTGLNSLEMLRRVVHTEGVMSLYRGWTPTLLREVPGYGLYFSTYEAVKRYKQNVPLKGWEAFLTGSLCGSVAWLFIYPSDPVKTMMQKDNIGVRMAINNIVKEYGIKGFYRGFSWGIARACILHGGVFFGYEMSKRYTI